MPAVAKPAFAVHVEAQPDADKGTVPDVEFRRGEMEGKIARGWSIGDKRLTNGGSVAVGFTIYPDGHVREIKLVKSSGSGDVDVAAIRAVFLGGPFQQLRARSTAGEYNVVFGLPFGCGRDYCCEVAHHEGTPANKRMQLTKHGRDHGRFWSFAADAPC